MIRLFVPDDLAQGAEISLAPAQSHYLRDVMRRGVGDEVLLFNGRDGEWRAAVVGLEKRGARLGLRERVRPQACGPDVELVVALVKRARLETIVEKATELGVRRIRLCVTRFTQAERTNVSRLSAIAVEAAEQTGRLDVPEVVGPEKLGTILQTWPQTRRLIFCDEEGQCAPILGALLPGPASVLIGPEGGFAAEEREQLRSLPYVIPVSLGPRILRADTAAIAALTLWQASLGDWAP